MAARKRLIALALWLTAAASGGTVLPAQAAAPAPAVALLPGAEAIAGWTAFLAGEMQSRGIPGATVAVGIGGELVWTRGFGHADLENEVPASEHTVYRLASISKPMTAVLAMRLAAAGQLDLDRPVQDYVPGFPVKRWPLTPRHLLSHLGGVRHYRGREIYSTRSYASVQAALHIFASDPLVHEPGTKFLYTSYGYNLLGAVAEAAASGSFEALLEKHIHEPAGMRHTRIDRINAIIPHRAQGYVRTKEGRIENSRIVDTSNKLPSGGLCGTAADLVRFGNALLAGKLVDRPTLDAMWTPACTREGRASAYGLGFRILRAEKPRIIGHSGGQPRVSTMLVLRPEEGVVVAWMSNLERSGAGGIARQLSDKVAAARQSAPGSEPASTR